MVGLQAGNNHHVCKFLVLFILGLHMFILLHANLKAQCDCFITSEPLYIHVTAVVINILGNPKNGIYSITIVVFVHILYVLCIYPINANVIFNESVLFLEVIVFHASTIYTVCTLRHIYAIYVHTYVSVHLSQ